MPIDGFVKELSAFGLAVPKNGVIADDRYHRVADMLKAKKNLDGWYRLKKLSSGLTIGYAGSFWRCRGSFKWASRASRNYTVADRDALDAVRRKVQAEQEKRHALGAERAVRAWTEETSAVISHAYLSKKQVASHGLRQNERGQLVVPIRSLAGDLLGLQTIAPDGTKRYSFGANRSVCGGHWLGVLAGAPVVAVAEGYATGATIHEATGWPTFCALDANGLERSAKPLRHILPGTSLVFAGDHDLARGGGIGQLKAQAAANACGGIAVIPPVEGTDWNDHAHAAGIADVRERLFAAVGLNVSPKVSEKEPSEGHGLAARFASAFRGLRSTASASLPGVEQFLRKLTSRSGGTVLSAARAKKP